MPHLEAQFPSVNPLALPRPNALDSPDRKEEETNRIENPAKGETPIPGSLADGIDRVTLSAKVRAAAPVRQTGETAPVPGNVEALDENPQALRPDNLGTAPALRSNRELRNILREFNARIEPLEEVTEPEGAPVAEVQSKAPPPPAVFENLEAVGQVTAAIQDNRPLLTSRTNDVVLFNLGFFEVDANELVAYKKVRLNAAESSLQNFWKARTERGQNIDRFI
jgi:hypothetical protein